MVLNIKITEPIQEDRKAIYSVFDTTIREAFQAEGLGSWDEVIRKEIAYKKQLLADSLAIMESEVFFFIAKWEGQVVGTISFGPCGEDIRKCTANELEEIGEVGSLFVLPSYQGQGIGSALIQAMAERNAAMGRSQFCLDSGYKQAQKRWLRKFGVPYKVVKDYWGQGLDHMIWLCSVSDFKTRA
jgi:GNAT superfamily N-acetyltransferase